MRLDRTRCQQLLQDELRGVLATAHPGRGADAVPTCFVIDDDVVATPVDRVKPKSSVYLQRTRNLDLDRRATLLCDHWDPLDWSQLWWVRLSLERTSVEGDREARLASLLRGRYRQYEDEGFTSLLVFRIVDTVGWSAAGD